MFTRNHLNNLRLFKALMFLVLVVLLLLAASACGGAETRVPFFTPTTTSTVTATVVPTETPTPGITLPATHTPTPEATQPPTSTVTPENMGGASQTFAITIHNTLEWDAHLFVDNVYALTVPARDSAIYKNAPGGAHTVHFCQVQQILTCDAPQSIMIAGNFEWSVGEPFPGGPTAGSGISTRQPGIPTPPIQAKRVHIIKINNHTPWDIYVFLDNQIVIKPTNTPSLLDTPEVEKPKQEFIPFLSIPENTFRTFNGLTTGSYTFIHCYDKSMKRCFEEKTIKLERDTEWHIYPR